jgi:hypothetical protein
MRKRLEATKRLFSAQTISQREYRNYNSLEVNNLRI